MRPALRLLRLRTCVRCLWIRVQEQHRHWPLRFLHLGAKIRRPLALKLHRRITRRRAASSKDSADFLPRCFDDVAAPGDAASRVSTELDCSLGLNWSRRVLRALFQDYGYFKQRSIGILVYLPTEFIESRALE